MLIHRRNLILGIGSPAATLAIVRAQAIMPVKTMIWDGRIPVMVIEMYTNSLWDTHAIRIDETEEWVRWKVWNPVRRTYCQLINPDRHLQEGDQINSYGGFVLGPEGDLIGGGKVIIKAERSALIDGAVEWR